MNEFRHSPYWKHRFIMRVQFFKGSIFNHVIPVIIPDYQNDLLRCGFMSASDVVFIPDRHKSLTDRDKETVLALVSLENSFDTNSRYVDYVNRLPKKVVFLVFHYSVGS